MCPPENNHCNRQPFVSGDGCDRGNVDVHMFDELPYCGTIAPTPPGIPPEIVDTPINIPIPPSCACVNISYDMDMKYTTARAFKAEGSFNANGDCCEGKYKSKFDLEIPCPALGNGTKRIRLAIGYGDNARSCSASFISLNKSECTIDANNVDMNLNIPCPVKKADTNKIKVGISYGKEFRNGSASFIKADSRDCTIEPLSPEINLNIPCPVIGRDEGNRIAAEIRYGTSFRGASASFIRTDAEDCKIEGLNAKLDLSIPCPVVKNEAPRIKVGISYGEAFAGASASLAKADDTNCTIEPLSPEINLNIPCPLSKIKIEASYVELGSSGTGEITVDSFYSNAGCSKTFKIKAAIPNPSLNVPCPVGGEPGTKKIKMKMSVGGNASGSASAEFATVGNSGDCNISVQSVNMNLSIPCPIALSNDNSKKMRIGFDTIRYDGMPGISFDTGSMGLGWSGFGVSSCKLELNSKKFKLRALPPTTYDRLKISTRCTTTSDSFGSFAFSSSFDNANCQRNINLRVKFPAVSKDISVITEIQWNAAEHKLQYKKTNLKTGTEDAEWTDIFTAVGHMSDHRNCNDR